MEVGKSYYIIDNIAKLIFKAKVLECVDHVDINGGDTILVNVKTKSGHEEWIKLGNLFETLAQAKIEMLVDLENATEKSREAIVCMSAIGE